MMSLSAAPAVISRYFELDGERDVDGVTALFADDATVVDERETHREGLRSAPGASARRRASRTPPKSSEPNPTARIATWSRLA